MASATLAVLNARRELEEGEGEDGERPARHSRPSGYGLTYPEDQLSFPSRAPTEPPTADAAPTQLGHGALGAEESPSGLRRRVGSGASTPRSLSPSRARTPPRRLAKRTDTEPLVEPRRTPLRRATPPPRDARASRTSVRSNSMSGPAPVVRGVGSLRDARSGGTLAPPAGPNGRTPRRSQSLAGPLPPRQLARRSSIEAVIEARLAELARAGSRPEPWTAAWAQQAARAVYETAPVQLLVALLIVANFLQAAIEAQLAEVRTDASVRVFAAAEWAFACAFSVELAWNAYAYWCRPFWASGWNVFDVLIVTVTWVKLLAASVPGVSVLRLFRAFRVLRLFKRVESLRTIIEAIFDALPKVGNAIIVLGVLMGIWSIIAVDFFGPYAHAEFGTFARAMFTMYQVKTLDGWAAIARPIIYESNAENVIKGSGFFVSYTFATSVVLSNVIVTIMIDNYLRAIDRAKEAKEEAEALARAEAERAELEAMRELHRLAAQQQAEAVANGAVADELSTHILDEESAAQLAPSVLREVLWTLCAPRKLRRLGRAQLLDLAAVLHTSQLTRERFSHYALGKVASGKVPHGTDAGDVLRFLACRALHGAADGIEEEADDEGGGDGDDDDDAAGARALADREPAHAGGAPGTPGDGRGAAEPADMAVTEAPTTPTAIEARSPHEHERRPQLDLAGAAASAEVGRAQQQLVRELMSASARAYAQSARPGARRPPAQPPPACEVEAASSSSSSLTPSSRPPRSRPSFEADGGNDDDKQHHRAGPSDRV